MGNRVILPDRIANEILLVFDRPKTFSSHDEMAGKKS